MRKPIITLNLYLPSHKKKLEIRRKAKALDPDKSVSQIVVDYFDSLPDAK
jgi:hypothetical protein